jgi:hypothetical protein
MSGINSRLIHDSCAISEKIKTSCTAGDYSMFLDYHINPNFRKASDVPCINSVKTVGCDACDKNKNATLELGPQTFGELTSIENNLRGIHRNLSKCSNQQFMSCELNPNSESRIKGECDNVVILNPYLCERNIVPTNLKFPTSRGF